LRLTRSAGGERRLLLSWAKAGNAVAFAPLVGYEVQYIFDGAVIY